jgi:hypothetical protein
MKRKILLGLHTLFWVVFLGLAGYIAMHPKEVRYSLRDWWRLRSYEAPVYAREFSDQLNLSDEARRIFYASSPMLQDKPGFVSACPFPEQSFVIGCYDGDRIYILDVTEKDLESVEPVTAAHELLHAAWLRLDNDEQKDLARQLRSVFSASQDDALHELIEKYQAAGNNREVINSELHSILATEVHQLTPELEAYYARYFGDRTAIVQLYDSYRATFARNQAQVDAIKARLDRTKADIDSIQAELSSLKPEIDAGNAQLETYAAARDNANYNRLLPLQRSRINRYNQQVRSYNSGVEQYRQLAKDLLALSLRHNELVDAIDATKVQKLEGQ